MTRGLRAGEIPRTALAALRPHLASPPADPQAFLGALRLSERGLTRGGAATFVLWVGDAARPGGGRFFVAGEFYEDKQPYLDLVEKNGLQNQVIFHSQFIPNEEVRYYFCAADLVAQTYRNATNSGVTMVGYYYEKPMLVTDVGGLSELVPHQKIGYTVPIDVAKITESILDFFKNHREQEFIIF